MTEKIKKISNKTDFICFLNELAKDFNKNPAQWENMAIPEYLTQIAGWIEDYSECPANDIKWEHIDYQVLARIFYMGKIYE